MSRSLQRPRHILLLSVGLLAVAVGLSTQATGVLDRVDYALVDQAFRTRGTDPTRLRDMVFVGIDDVSITALQRRVERTGVGEPRYPFDRTVHAQLVKRLTRAGVRRIVYDIDFDGRTSGDGDEALAQALLDGPPFALAATAVNQDGITATLGSEKNVGPLGGKVGLALLLPDGDGVLRTVTRTALGRETLPVVAARVLGARAQAQALARGALIDYAGPAGTIRSVSFIDVLRGKVPRSLLHGKAVVIGAQTPALNDVESTPFGEPKMPGTEVLANAIATVQRGAPLRERRWPGWLGAFLAGVMIPALGVVLRARLIAVVAGAVLLALPAGAYALFLSGTVVPLAPTLAALALGTLGTGVVAASLAAVGRRDASMLLHRFVPEAIAQRLLDHGTGAVLQPELRQATVMFCDVRGFSTWAEGRSAAEVLALLTLWLERVTEVVMRHGGSVVSFQGDGVMSVFGAPTDHDDDAAAALAAGSEITGPLVAGLPGPAADGGPFRAGAGIHRGEVSSGTVGSAQRLEYAAIGDTTVVAARLQAATKEHGVSLLISASTAADRHDAGIELHEVGVVGLRGRSEPIVVLGLGRHGAAADGHAAGGGRSSGVTRGGRKPNVIPNGNADPFPA